MTDCCEGGLRFPYLDQLSDYQSLKMDSTAAVSNSNSPAPEQILNKCQFKLNKCSRDKRSIHIGFPQVHQSTQLSTSVAASQSVARLLKNAKYKTIGCATKNSYRNYKSNVIARKCTGTGEMC